MDRDALIALAKTAAATHQLDQALVCAVCEQESGWNPWAVRFEPAFEQRYIHPALPSAPSTLELTKAMSFGLMQVMGEVAIEFGFPGVFVTQLCDPAASLEFGCRKLAKCLSLHSGDVHAALQAWNGGGNPNYADEVIARMGNYQ